MTVAIFVEMNDSFDPEKMTELMEKISSGNDAEMEAALEELEASLGKYEPPLPAPFLFNQVRDPSMPFEDFKKACLSDLDLKFEGKNLLFPAMASGSLKKIQWLVEMGLDLCQTDESGYSLLTTASFLHRDDDAIFDYFCQMKANFDQESSYGESALSVSIQTGRYDRVRTLLENGADASIASFSLLHQAAAMGDLSRIQMEANSKILESRDRWERTPWLTALCADQVETAQLLEELGADIEVVDHVGDEAIHLVAQCNAPQALAYLIGKGITVGKPGHFKQTALHAAAEYDSLSCAKLLLESGAQIDPLNETEAQPISLARSLEMIQLLHKAGANLNFVCGAGEWPLRDFADDGDLEALRWMLENGADANLTSTGETALFNAIRSDQLEAAALLIEFGADVNAQDVDGDGLFFRCESKEAAKFLIEKGADQSLRNQIGETAAQASYVSDEVRSYLSSQMSKLD